MAGLILTVASFPTTAWAQTASISPADVPRAVDIGTPVWLAQASAPPAAGQRSAADKAIVIGAVVGGGIAGAYMGEFWFGQKLGMAHGPDILVGAGVGALAGFLTRRSSDRAPGAAKPAIGVVTIAPVVLPGRRGVLVKIAG
jgi:hypothetical protein